MAFELDGSVIIDDSRNVVAGAAATFTYLEAATAQITGDYINIDGNLDVAQDIRHLGDNNTKITFPSAGDIIQFETAGSERLRITSDGIVRIKRTATTSLGNDSTYLGIGDDENGANSNRMIGFGYVQNVGDSVYPASMGYTETSNTSHTKGALVFNTRDTTTYNDAPTERMRITSSGDVGIGTITINTSNGQVGKKFGIFSSQNNVLISETTSSSHGLLIEARRTGRDTDKPRYAQLGLHQDGNGDGIIKFSTAADSADVTERLRITSAGNVGIGTDEPDEILHLGQVGTADNDYNEGRLKIGGFQNLSSGLLIGYDNRGSGRTNIVNANNSGSDANRINIGFGSITASGAPTFEVVTINQNGLVGIGTNNPDNGLHVSDGSSYAAPQNTGAGKVMIEHASSADLQFMTANSGYNHIFFGDQDDANIGSIVYHHASNANAMVFNTNTAEVLRIDSSGNLGIGTDNPSSLLDVWGANGAGQIRLVETNHTNGNRYGKVMEYAGNLYFQSRNDTGDGGFVFRGEDASATTEFARITSTGQLLIGTLGSSSSLPDGFGSTFQIEGTSATSSSIAITRNSNDENPSYLTFGKSKGTSVGSNTAVAAGDNIGAIDFKGSDGSSNFNLFAKIEGGVDNLATGNSDAPGRLSFYTTADEGISNQERVRINSTGITTFYKDITLEDGGSVRFSVSHTSGGNVLIKNPTAANLTFETPGGTNQLNLNSDGNIGIHEGSPSNMLEISSNGNSKGLVVSKGGTNAVEVIHNGSGNEGLIYLKDDGVLKTMLYAGDDVSSFFLNDVGIGTNLAYSNASYNSLSVGGSKKGLIEINDDSDVPRAHLYTDGGDFKVSTVGTAGTIRFITGGTLVEHLTIASGGNVTTTGNSTFSRGDAGFTARKGDSVSVTRADGTPLEITRTSAQGNMINFFDTDASTQRANIQLNSNDLVFGLTSEKFRITSGGQLQATSAADVRLTLGSSGTAGTNDSVHIRADSADLKFMAADGGDTIFEENGTETLRIHSTGQLELKVPDSVATLKLTPSGTNAPATIDFNTPGTGSAVFKVQGTQRLGITTTGLLKAYGTYNGSSTGSNDFPALNINNSQGSYTDNNIIGGVTFGKSAGHSSGVRAGMLALYAASGSLGANVGTHLVFRTAVEDGGDSIERLRITSSGAVRIANTATQTNTSADDLIVGTTSGHRGITIFSATDGTGNLYFGDTDQDGVGNSMGAITYSHDGNSMRFSTNGHNERLRITSDGDVGVGTDNPSALLDVGNTGIATASTVINATAWEGQVFNVDGNLSSDSIFAVNDISGLPVIDFNATHSQLSLAPFGGNVSIGYTNSGTKLGLKGSTSERVYIVNDEITDVSSVNIDNGNVQYYDVKETDTSGFTVNITSNNTLNVDLAIGDSVNVVLIIISGGSTTKISEITIDGSAATEEWLGGSAPSGGADGTYDVYTFFILKTANATFLPLCNKVNYA